MHFFLKNVTPPAKAIDRRNNQPCIVTVEDNVFMQYFICIEQQLMTRAKDF